MTAAKTINSFFEVLGKKKLKVKG